MDTPNIKTLRESTLGRHDMQDVYPITYIEAVKGLKNKLAALDTACNEFRQSLDELGGAFFTMMGNEDPTPNKIDTFNEIVTFLNGISGITLKELLDSLQSYTDNHALTTYFGGYLSQAGVDVRSIKGLNTLRVNGNTGNTSGILITDTPPPSGDVKGNTCAIYNNAGTLTINSASGVDFNFNKVRGISHLEMVTTGVITLGAAGKIQLAPLTDSYIRFGSNNHIVLHNQSGVDIEDTLNIGDITLSSGQLSMPSGAIYGVTGIGMQSGSISGVSQIAFTNGVILSGGINLENVGDIISTGGRLAGFAVADAGVINAGKASDHKDIVSLDSDGVLVVPANGGTGTTIKSSVISLGTSGTLQINGGTVNNVWRMNLTTGQGAIGAWYGNIQDLNKVSFSDGTAVSTKPEIGVDIDDPESLSVKTNIFTVGNPDGNTTNIDHNKIYFNGDLQSGTGVIQGAFLSGGVFTDSIKFTSGFITALQDALNGGTGHIYT